MILLRLFGDLVTLAFLVYTFSLGLSYLLLGLYSLGETREYLRRNSFTDYRTLAVSEYAPGISILAPAYNESATIIDNVRSLLSLYYPNMELIIINDGSRDDTLQRLVEAYDLVRVPHCVPGRLPTKPLRGVYRSRHAVYGNLIVLDKENGGKSDALNAGVNFSARQLVTCVDVDCIMEPDALLKMAKPFLESQGPRIIAAGGVIRIANSCVVEEGRLVEVRLPARWQPRFQVLEYIRAFLLGRMAWSRLGGLILVSGAFGAFDREILLEAGGYDARTVGEDMELTIRMRRYMAERGRPYRVTYIPDPLCWTEAPSSYRILARQRNRWARGTIESLYKHLDLLGRRRYGIMGMVSLPYWLLFEFLAPVVEFLSLLIFAVLCAMGRVDWTFFFILLAFVLSFAYAYSAMSLLTEVLTFNQYRRKRDMLRLLGSVLLEPFLFHPLVVWAALSGHKDYLLRRNKGWGDMKRSGFARPGSTASAASGG